MVVYKITNLINSKIYIGLDTKNNPNYFGSGVLIKSAIKKYGKHNFKKEILDYCSCVNELKEREIHRIDQYLSSVENIGYNITEGGDGCVGYKHRNSHIEHMKSLKRDYNWKKNISESLKGIKHDYKRIENNRNAQIGLQKGEKNPRAKTFEFISPDGIKYTVKGRLRNFCKEHKLSYQLILKIRKNNKSFYKNWKIIEKN